MANHLLDAGYSLNVYNRSPEKARPLLDRGAAWKDSAGEAASDADAVITMVGTPNDVELLYLGEGGIFDRGTPNALMIDMTTSSPMLATRLAEEGARRGFRIMDAPVSGGDAGARNATLSIMAGGSPKDFEASRALLTVMGNKVVLQGPPGSGQYCKMCNQIAIAGTMLGMTEALIFALRAGLDPATVLNSIESGAAASWSLSNLMPRILDGNLEPGFYIKHFKKDLNIALEAAREMAIKMPGTELANRMYTALAALGRRELDTARELANRYAANEWLEFKELSESTESGSDLGTHALFMLYIAGRV